MPLALIFASVTVFDFAQITMGFNESFRSGFARWGDIVISLLKALTIDSGVYRGVNGIE